MAFPFEQCVCPQCKNVFKKGPRAVATHRMRAQGHRKPVSCLIASTLSAGHGFLTMHSILARTTATRFLSSQPVEAKSTFFPQCLSFVLCTAGCFPTLLTTCCLWLVLSRVKKRDRPKEPESMDTEQWRETSSAACDAQRVTKSLVRAPWRLNTCNAEHSDVVARCWTACCSDSQML